ncbi:Pro-Pol polyprotein [Melipona quadrifasciata]|uniref:RNA-directed DNA polymerase n=1 Tax=Melipona quadrifasciata TaxID=166423 RepID=A0A0N0BHT0_9HYME|nr:Pro-Pol polyprotein [Melipona quadrifasciata]
MVREAHERRHFSVTKIENLPRRDYWMQGMKRKIEVIQNCISCILAERKRGRQERYLHPLEKGEVPLETFHIDHLGLLFGTKKNYKHIFVVVDAFTKFVWLYATKTTNSAEVIERLWKQSVTFGNARRIISDRGTAFTSREFAQYCQQENIHHSLITTGVPRANGQVERVNRTLILLLIRISNPKKEDWYKYLEIAQFLNTSFHRNIGTTPFQLLFGTSARLKDDPHIRLMEEEWVTAFENDRDELRIETCKLLQKYRMKIDVILIRREKRQRNKEKEI